MSGKCLSLKEYINRIPIEYRQNLILLEEFKGVRTNISFTFSCGCQVKQSLKAFLDRNRFDCCVKCKVKYSIIYTCKYCQTNFIRFDMFEQCQAKCLDKYKNLVEGRDYVICAICGLHAKSLGMHVSKEHNIDIEEYKKEHQIICYNSSNIYSNQNGLNGDWINRATENNIDLTGYWEKVSEGVREAILSNPVERMRRSEMMTKLNDRQQSDPSFKELVSKTAQLTSARPEIMEARAKRLKNWRENNSEDFYEKCIKKMITTFQSKPEKKLFEFVSSLDGFNFKRNQFMKSINFSSVSNKRQIDIFDKEKRIYIEYDGHIHFKDIFGIDVLQKNKIKDNEIEHHISNHGWTLIRISYDQYVDRNKIEKSYFKQGCLDRIVEILNNRVPGIYKIGAAYV
jgi:hypothetical protein